MRRVSARLTVVTPDGKLRFEVAGDHGATALSAPVPVGQFIHVAATVDALKVWQAAGLVG